ncbi:Protein kinase domain-containing protein [Mycena indigotica]|uniref:Carbonic anhydrase n=1 Tax=Mycena indigotica TaxID=2126181 RepID=A0A8H6SUS2_9AGAR|nr:Protein kinase domain-containing protein [Mycena indigotica]KAF7306560.1 Protein kinase domain-containing protein [Mycena indigotica]
MEQLLIEGNTKYAPAHQTWTRAERFKNIIVVCCMDPRINPYEQLGLESGAAITIRNAGGSAKEALRSILVAQHAIKVGTHIAVLHHTDCGMTKTTTPEMQHLVKDWCSGNTQVAEAVERIDFYHISDLKDSVKRDVEWLKSNPMIKPAEVSGWIYDVETGKITEVAA